MTYLSVGKGKSVINWETASLPNVLSVENHGTHDIALASAVALCCCCSYHQLLVQYNSRFEFSFDKRSTAAELIQCYISGKQK